MEFTLKNFIDSGAVRHICYYAASECGTPVDWYKVSEYIAREFRDAPREVLLELLEYCQKCYDSAESLNLEVPT